MMKNKTLAAALLAAAFAMGCNQEPTTSQQLDKVKTETKQAAQDMKDYTFAQKNEFVLAMQTQLTTLDKDWTNSAPKSKNPAMRSRPKPNPNIKRFAIRRPS
jgi:hypothetical protein